MWIVSRDTVFAEALQIALRESGMDAEILSSLPARTTDADGWIVDLDALPTAHSPSHSATLPSAHSTSHSAPLPTAHSATQPTAHSPSHSATQPTALPQTMSALPAHTITIARSRSAHPNADFIRPFLFRALIAEAKERFALSSPLPTGEIPVRRASGTPFLILLPNGVRMNGQDIELSPSERAVLALLLKTPGECVPTEQIDRLWQEKGGNTTAVYIRYLRKKLDEPSGLRLIRSVRGRGYCLCLPN